MKNIKVSANPVVIVVTSGPANPDANEMFVYSTADLAVDDVFECFAEGSSPQSIMGSQLTKEEAVAMLANNNCVFAVYDAHDGQYFYRLEVKVLN